MDESPALSLPYPATDRFTRLTPRECRRRLQQARAGIRSRAQVWVFAYGSLMWNPAFEPLEQCVVHAPGFVRRYCFWTISSRGNRQAPGLGLGIEAGPRGCTGIAQRMDPRRLDEQFARLWRREMGTGVYHATWMPLFTREGRRIRGLGFVADQNHSHYVNDLDPVCMAHIVRRAEGAYGRCRDYLERLLMELHAMEVVEPELEQLLARVDRI